MMASMLAGIGRALVDGLADVDAVVEELIEVALVDRLARLSRMPSVIERTGDQNGGGANLREPFEYHANGCSLGFVYDQLAVFDLVAERDEAAHPHALLARGGELVADALADDLALELGEGEQDVKRQPAHRASSC